MAAPVVHIKQEVLTTDDSTTSSTGGLVLTSSGTLSTAVQSPALALVSGTQGVVSPQVLISNAEALQKNIQYLNEMVTANGLVAAGAVRPPVIPATPTSTSNGSVLVVPQPFPQYFTYYRNPSTESTPATTTEVSPSNQGAEALDLSKATTKLSPAPSSEADKSLEDEPENLSLQSDTSTVSASSPNSIDGK